MALPIASCEAERNFSKQSFIKKQISIIHARGKTELSFFRSIENCITKSLLYEETIKQYVATKCREKMYYRCARQLINENITLFSEFVVFVVCHFVKFVICCDFFSYSK
jgi:hypothetical protein